MLVLCIQRYLSTWLHTGRWILRGDKLKPSKKSTDFFGNFCFWRSCGPWTCVGRHGKNSPRLPRCLYYVSKGIWALSCSGDDGSCTEKNSNHRNFRPFFSKIFAFDDLAQPELAWGIMNKIPRTSGDVCTMYPKAFEHLVAQVTMDPARRRTQSIENFDRFFRKFLLSMILRPLNLRGASWLKFPACPTMSVLCIQTHLSTWLRPWSWILHGEKIKPSKSSTDFFGNFCFRRSCGP